MFLGKEWLIDEHCFMLTLLGLKEEGLFRVSGVHDEIVKLKKRFDKGSIPFFS